MTLVINKRHIRAISTNTWMLFLLLFARFHQGVDVVVHPIHLGSGSNLTDRSSFNFTSVLAPGLVPWPT